MTQDDDFAFEPIPGLPERLPEGEEILWQGRPEWFSLAKASLAFWWVVGWFIVLAIWRFIAVSDLMTFTQALWSVLPVLIMGVVVAAILLAFAYAQAKATVYTVTNKRIAMRVGAALQVTFNLPYVQIKTAELELRKDGTGTIAVELLGKNRVSYLVAWPHVRPWHFKTRPALRCIAEPQKVAGLIAAYAKARLDEPQVTVGPASAVAAE